MWKLVKQILNKRNYLWRERLFRFPSWLHVIVKHFSRFHFLLLVILALLFSSFVVNKRNECFNFLKMIFGIFINLLFFVPSVPYTEVDEDSALVEMFGQVGAFRCKYIVAVGALAGLTVSMFGSMFPMPRIIYAMAQDGLIFR